jgi:HEPN domain-containing protein
VRKVHDLDILLDPCAQIDPSFEALKAEVVFLNQFYVETRYPGDFPQFTFTDAQKALESAKRIKEFVLEKINTIQ